MNNSHAAKVNKTGAWKKLFRSKYFTSAIILVGGSSNRFGGDVPKQFISLSGMPLAVHSILAFENSSLIDEIVVVCRQGDEAFYQKVGEEYGVTKLSAVVCGGKTRQESSFNGVNAAKKDAGYILIHDGARPLVTDEIIRDVVLCAHSHKAACAAIPCRDTVKIADTKGCIKKTEDRNFVHLAATPQGFYKPLYEACAYSAVKDNFEATDDASLLEHYFYKVRLVDCTSENIKITTPSDLIIAEAILTARKKECDL